MPAFQFAQVLLPFGDVVSNRPYTYSVPPELQEKLAVGDSVWVPFRNSTACGIVVEFCEDSNRPTKSIHEKNRSLSSLSPEVLHFSKWLANRYLSSWWDALRNFIIPINGHSVSQNEVHAPREPIQLTLEQENAVFQIKSSLLDAKFKTFLLHGITGSGKTEVYLSAALEAVKSGKEVLVLVPEIPLSFQVSKRFREFFGDRVAVLHSGLTEKEKREEQAKLRQRQASIVVGPRMALYAPFEKLGLVILDEEHDPSYKQESHPRYHASMVAEKLAQSYNATVVLGSATPSLESYYLAKQGKIGHLVLSSRYESRPLPQVNIVDLRNEASPEIRPFSQALLDGLKETIIKGEQAILFLNRRGFSPLVLCRDCGHTFDCPNCSISLNFHLTRKLLRCHYCDYQNLLPEKCPACQGSRLTYRGFGTERLEEKIRELLPLAKVLRLDRDIASKRGRTKAVLESFAKGEANILLGTQMVTKGFDFQNVSLVGIIFADHLLHFPDFRSGERTFQLITQVSGRAGRGQIPGRVILQTYDPDHMVIQAAARQDYSLFYGEEIENRQKACYPPFVSLANFLLTGPEEPELEKQGLALREFILAAIPPEEKSFLLGPSPCPIQKIAKNFRWHLLLKSTHVESLIEASKKVYGWYSENGSRKVRLTIDIDPVRLL